MLQKSHIKSINSLEEISTKILNVGYTGYVMMNCVISVGALLSALLIMEMYLMINTK
jgi:hypothetical protein